MVEDKIVRCVEKFCGKAEFVITANEQEFYKQKNFELPKRCEDCRARRKAEKQSGKGGKR